MNFQWILLACFLVALISGVSKAITRPMLKNILRLASVPIAFLITYIFQLCGVFQQIAASVIAIFNLASMIPGFEDAAGFINALAGTLISPILFVAVFFISLWALRIVIFIALKVADNIKAKKKEKEALAVQVAAAVAPTDTEQCEDTETPVSVTENADAVSEEKTEAVSDAVAEKAQAEPSVNTAESNSEESPKKKKRRAIPDECAWKRVVSIATGIVASLLVLAVSFMPIFYYMSVVTTAVNGINGSDADDSQVYQVVSVVDEYIATPYEDSFVVKFYDTFGLSDLMILATREGGKTALESGDVVYADDVLKNLLRHGVSAAAQITSAKSEYATLENDLDVIVSDPLVASVLADAIVLGLDQLDIEEPAEEDLIGGLTNTFLNHYREADKTVIEKDLKAVTKTVAALAKSGVLIELIGGEVDMEELLSNEETLGEVVGSISGLSAFGPTIEGAFELGIDMLGDTLQIPADDAEAYERFMDDLSEQMRRDTNVKFDYNLIRYYIVNCASQNKKVSSSNGIKGHSQFVEYVAHWEKVQAAFAHASEDTSYGYFTIDINGERYVYDKNKYTVTVYNSETEADYKDKVSPLAGIINYLTLNSTASEMSRENIYTLLDRYVFSSTADEVSKEVAERILSRDGFVSKAVTVEKMLAATDFKDWTDEEKSSDSKLCVSIIMKLMGLMDSLGNADMSSGVEGANEMLGQFELLGETMDLMKQTSCINELPPLLIEGIVKNEMFEDYMKPSIAFQINNKVETNNNTYEECMKQIAGILKFAMGTLGGEIK